MNRSTSEANKSHAGKFRIKHRRDFLRLQSEGEKLYATHFLVSVAPAQTAESRLGIAITKKVAPRAVDRNRVKRRIREIFRLYRSDFAAQLDIVIVARRDAHLCSFEQTRHEFLSPLKRGGFLRKDHQPW